jgi:hypothetical protein
MEACRVDSVLRLMYVGESSLQVARKCALLLSRAMWTSARLGDKMVLRRAKDASLSPRATGLCKLIE